MPDATVPFLDLGAMAREIWPSIEAEYIKAVLAGKYIGGPAVETFERDWADYCGTRHAIGVANGTDAILLTLEALGIGPGDDVILPANTFIATAEAIVRAGATPRFADVDPDTLLLTADTLAAALTPNTRAVIAVHLYGQTPNMDQLLATANHHGIHLIEDAAQAHGAEWKSQRAGSFGTTGCFSFYPGKNLGAFGDAGAVTTNDPHLAATIRAIANHGRAGGSAHYEHQHLGTNSRLDALQALVLTAKLARNETWTENRIALAKDYRARLDGTAAKLVTVAPEARHVYHLLVARVPNRERIQGMLAAQNIQTGVHYPLPCHQQPPFRRFADRPLPVCEESAGELLSLPIYPHMTTEQLDHVCQSLSTALETTLDGEVLTNVRAG
jgi:dTDP-4-amino-4,6-dideoxygalactose transaminase